MLNSFILRQSIIKEVVVYRGVLCTTNWWAKATNTIVCFACCTLSAHFALVKWIVIDQFMKWSLKSAGQRKVGLNILCYSLHLTSLRTVKPRSIISKKVKIINLLRKRVGNWWWWDNLTLFWIGKNFTKSVTIRKAKPRMMDWGFTWFLMKSSFSLNVCHTFKGASNVKSLYIDSFQSQLNGYNF